MKTRAAAAVLFLLACAVGRTRGEAVPPFELAGILIDAGEPQLRVIDPLGGQARWLRIGQVISGFELVSFDPARETATLVRDDVEVRVRLAEGKIRAAPAGLPPYQVRAIQANLQLILSAARLHFLEGRGRYVTFADLVGPDKYLERITPVAGESYAALSFMKGETNQLSVLTPTGTAVTFDDRAGR